MPVVAEWDNDGAEIASCGIIRHRVGVVYGIWWKIIYMEYVTMVYAYPSARNELGGASAMLNRNRRWTSMV